jgi:hypothetical protein
MIFAKQRIIPITTNEEHMDALELVQITKNLSYQDGLLIQRFSDSEISKFQQYWDIVKTIVNVSCLSIGEYQLLWKGRTGTEQYVFEIDSKTGHLLVFYFYPSVKEYSVFYFSDRDYPYPDEVIDGKISNLSSSLKVKNLVKQFQS